MTNPWVLPTYQTRTKGRRVVWLGWRWRSTRSFSERLGEAVGTAGLFFGKARLRVAHDFRDARCKAGGFRFAPTSLKACAAWTMARMIYNLNKGLVTAWRALSPARPGGDLGQLCPSQMEFCRLDRTPDLLTSSHALVHRGHNPSKLVSPLRLELSLRLADQCFSAG